MRLLLTSVVQRLSGLGGDPVIQLQTAFGGGKTHTMLTVFHLATRKVDTRLLMGIPPILDTAGITELPNARVAFLDGIKLSSSQPLEHDGLTVNTLWGELAWQLAGQAGFALVQQADSDGTSPGKEVLIKLLTQAAPCVILIDELVAYIRQFEPRQHYHGGTFDSNLSFIQALTEALKAVPNALLLASLPESDLEVGGDNGQRVLNSLEKYFARVESVWKPVATEEAFEIVRRRLFDSVGDTAELDAVCQQFAELYRQGGNKFPPETQSHHYVERLRQSYPIHPEIFDRLYEDWSTLDKFQRTRAVGDQPRQKQNRLVFLAADTDVANRLRDQAKIFLAWQSIVADINNEKLNLDLFQVKQAKRYKELSGQTLQQMIRETYKWLICPVEHIVKDKPQTTWEVVSVSPTAPSLIQDIENRLKEEEWLIFEWSPIHLMNLLQRWYFKDGVTEIGALKVWQDCSHYLYLPRLVRDDVFKNAINLGLHSQDFFGFASGKSDDKYLGFMFGENTSIILDDQSLLIAHDVAVAYKESLKPIIPVITGGDDDDTDTDDGTPPPVIIPPIIIKPPVTATAKKHFYGTISLDPIKAKMDFATIVDEVIEQFTSKLGVDVKISIEIQATSTRDGFDEAMQWSIKENCNVLKFGNAEFEED
ncbi:MAG: DUF499 domain-containing protein [Methylococcaceae bacterium]